MKKIIALIVAMLSVAVFSTNKVTVPNRGTAYTPLTAANYNGNLDTLARGINQLCDTVDNNVVRYTASATNHDKIIPYARIDTIRSNTNIDSLSGNIIHSGSIVSSGPHSVDSLASAKGITATTGTFSGAVAVDSLHSTKGIVATTGAFSGTVNVDSLRSTKGVSYGAGITATSLTTTNDITSSSGLVSGSQIRGDQGFAYRQYVDTLTGRSNATIKSVGINADSLMSGNGGWFRCDSGSFPCTVMAVSGSISTNIDTIGIAHWQRIGKIVVMALKSIDACLLNSSTTARLANFPDSLCPATGSQLVKIPGYEGTYGLTLTLDNSITSNTLFRHPSANLECIYNPVFTYYLIAY